MNIKDKLEKLQENDVYSLILFVLYKMHDNGDYAALSELIYLLDKDSLLRLCQYYGGMTLKIPTIEELQQLIYCLTLYKYVNINKLTVQDAFKKLSCTEFTMKELLEKYEYIHSIVDNYIYNIKE